jgi:hypothetical protein
MKIIILALLICAATGCTKEKPSICWTVTHVKMTSINNYLVTYVHKKDTLFIKQNHYSIVGSNTCGNSGLTNPY